MATVSLKPALVNLKGIRAGDKNEFRVEVVRGDAAEDITGRTFTAQARFDEFDTNTVDAVIDIIDAPGGVLMLRWPGDAVRTWLDGAEDAPVNTVTGVWDLQMSVDTDDPQRFTMSALPCDSPCSDPVKVKV